MPNEIERPKPEKQLFENLFIKRDYDETLEAISQGLVAFVDNSDRLLEDATILLKEKRFASAQFLITTADEEMAKSYILLDACRLDFSRHASVLQRLCRAFYDHVTKYSYNQVVRFSNFHDMEHVKEIWEIETTKWWPSNDYESGEPDMPHETYFVREMPLYVDFVDYDQKWSKPENIPYDYIFDKWDNGFLETRQALGQLQRTRQEGLFSTQSLSILNGNFKKAYITEKTLSDQIRRLYEKTAQEIEGKLNISKDVFFHSALHEWPLYHFTTTR